MLRLNRGRIFFSCIVGVGLKVGVFWKGGRVGRGEIWGGEKAFVCGMRCTFIRPQALRLKLGSTVMSNAEFSFTNGGTGVVGNYMHN